MKVSRFAVRHPVYITMILFALLLFGFVSLSDTKTEFMGDISLPTAFVIAVYPGASAAEVEEEIVDVLERDFITLPNYSSMKSTANNSMAVIEVTYQNGIDVYDQLEELRYRIDVLEALLPSGIAGIPQVIVGGASMLPVISFSLDVGSDFVGASYYIEDELLPLLTKIKGVSTVNITGAVDEELLIKLSTNELISKNVSPLAVYQILENSNLSVPLDSASYKDKTTNIKFDGTYDDIKDIENLTVGATENSKLIKIKDVAEVTLNQNIEKIMKSEGKNVIYIEVSKRTDGDTIHIIKEVKEILEKEELDSNGAIAFNVLADDSLIINTTLRSVITAGLLGCLIAIIVIFLSLGDIKATMIIGLSIPFSIFFTLIGLKIFNVSINLMSMSGIVIAIGTIVDGSIVMIEQVYAKYRLKKDDEYVYTVSQAIFSSSDEVGKSILGSALTTIAVFLPLLLIEGIVGIILKDVSLAFILALVGSAISAIIFIPFLLKLMLPEVRKDRKENIVEKIYNRLNRFYGKLVRWTIKHKFFIVMVCIALLIFTFWCVLQLKFAFIPSVDNNEFYVNIAYPASYTEERLEESMDYVESIVINEVSEIKTLVTTIGGSSGFDFSANSTTASIRVILEPVETRVRRVPQIIRDLKYLLDENIPDATIEVKNGGFDTLVGFVSGGGGFGLTLVGEDTKILYEEAKEIELFLQTLDDVLSTKVSTSFDNFEAVIKASNADLDSLGISRTEPSMTNAILFNGLDSGSYKENGRTYNIRLESDVKDKPISENTLNNIDVLTQSGKSITLASLADLEINSDITQIQHINRANSVTISAILTTESTTGVMFEVNKFLKNNTLPDGVSTQTGGMNELIMDSIGPILGAVTISMVLVFMVMVFQFESFSQPLLILITVPFCIIGVALALLGFGSTLNLLSVLGIISLGGISVNNGIILTDYMNMLVKRKRIRALEERGEIVDLDTKLTKRFTLVEEISFLTESIVESASSRLRSILMTTLTTMLGVVPMALGAGQGGEMYAPIGQAIAGGLLATTAVSLFLMPVLYFILEKKKLKKQYKGMNK